MKIGQQGSSGGYNLSDPPEFGPRNQADGTEAGLAWNNLVRPISRDLALSWFSDYPTEPFSDWVQAARDFTPEGVAAIKADFPHATLAEQRVVPAVMTRPEDLGSPVPLNDSPLATTLLDVLTELGVNGIPVSVVGAGGLLLDAEIPFAWQGSWGTGFGTRCNVWFHIMRTDDGVERAIFSTNLVISTRPIVNTNVAEITGSLVLAHPCQTLLYLAETPFASGLMSFTRGLAYGDVPVDMRPVPMAWTEEFALCSVLLGDTAGGQVSVNFATYPLVIRLGFAVASMSRDTLSTCLTVVIDALVKACTIVEDGFRNVRNLDSLDSFDQIFKSEFDLINASTEAIGQVDGYARWIPETLLGSLVKRTTDNYQYQYEKNLSNTERRAILQWVADFGAGASAAAGINSLAYSFLTPEREFDRAAFYLEQAIGMQVWNESTNALTNLGAMLISAGETERAHEVLDRALDQPDEFSEGEASLFLARLLRAQGDEDQARKYYQRAIDSDNPDYADVAEAELLGRSTPPTPPLSSSMAPPAPSSSGLAKFCGNCGSPFTAAGQKFCSECGSPRT